MNIGIVGHAQEKFTKLGKSRVLSLIVDILNSYSTKIVLISGHSPMGGVDIWAEEVSRQLSIPMNLKIPKQNIWDSEYGFKQRNIDIATTSQYTHVILADKYPPNYKGMKFNFCYHCKTNNHIKSGACWTAQYGKKLGRKTKWHIVKNY